MRADEEETRWNQRDAQICTYSRGMAMGSVLGLGLEMGAGRLSDASGRYRLLEDEYQNAIRKL